MYANITNLWEKPTGKAEFVEAFNLLENKGYKIEFSFSKRGEVFMHFDRYIIG